MYLQLIRKRAGLTCRSSIEEVKKCAENMLGHRLKTAQTAPEGVLVNKVRPISSLFGCTL